MSTKECHICLVSHPIQQLLYTDSQKKCAIIVSKICRKTATKCPFCRETLSPRISEKTCCPISLRPDSGLPHQQQRQLADKCTVIDSNGYFARSYRSYLRGFHLIIQTYLKPPTLLYLLLINLENINLLYFSFTSHSSGIGDKGTCLVKLFFFKCIIYFFCIFNILNF